MYCWLTVTRDEIPGSLVAKFEAVWQSTDVGPGQGAEKQNGEATAITPPPLWP